MEKRGNGEVSKSEKWFDIELTHKNSCKEKISVKTIFEDKKGTSGYIEYEPYKSNEKLSIIIIKLNQNLFPEKLLYIHDINNNLKNGQKNYLKRWSGKKKINFRYYNDNFDTVFADNIYVYDQDCSKFLQFKINDTN